MSSIHNAYLIGYIVQTTVLMHPNQFDGLTTHTITAMPFAAVLRLPVYDSKVNEALLLILSRLL